MVEWSKKRFDEISTRLGAFLKQAGYKDQDIFYVPVSGFICYHVLKIIVDYTRIKFINLGLTGENLAISPTESKLKEWYTGPTLLNAIGKIKHLFIYFLLTFKHGFSTTRWISFT